MSLLTGYYLVCLVYCFIQLFKNLDKRYGTDPANNSPELDTIMVVVMAWVLAPVDVTLTWIKWYKAAEEAKRRRLLYEQEQEIKQMWEDSQKSKTLTESSGKVY